MTKLSFVCILCLIANGLVFGALLDGQQAYYAFDGNFNDSSGNGNHGSAFGGVSFTSDQDGNSNSAANFNGSGHIDTGFLRAGFTEITVTAWFRYTGGINDGFRTIIGSDNGDFFVGKNSGNSNLGVQDGPYRPNMIVGSDAWNGEWHYVAYTFSGGIGTVFLDGTTITGTNTFGGAGGQINIGKESDNIFFFLGDIDEVRIFDRALSSSEVLQVQALTTVPEPSSVILLLFSVLVMGIYNKRSK